MKESCATCRWGGANDAISGLFPGDIICVNGESESCVDYADGCCGQREAGAA